MSNATANQTTAPMRQWLGGLAGMFVSDITATSDEVLTKSPGGVARAPYEFICEVTGFLRMVASIVRGEEVAMPSPEDIKAFNEANKTKDALLKNFEAAVSDFSTTLENADDARLHEVVMAPFGMEMPVIALANVAVNHIWYHDGQLNLIQAINGDGEVHWKM